MQNVLDIQCTLPLGGKPATKRASCWCFALCDDSGVCYFGDIWTLTVQVLFAK